MNWVYYGLEIDWYYCDLVCYYVYYERGLWVGYGELSNGFELGCDL